MHSYRHATTKAVVEAAESPGPEWDPIEAAGPPAELPVDPTGPGTVLTDAPTAEPRDLSGLDKDELLALADAEGIEVDRRLGVEKLAEHIAQAAPFAPPVERDLAPNT